MQRKSFRGTQWRSRSPEAAGGKAHQVPFGFSDSRRRRLPLPFSRDGGPEWSDLSLHYLKTQFTLSHLADGYCAVCKMSWWCIERPFCSDLWCRGNAGRRRGHIVAVSCPAGQSPAQMNSHPGQTLKSLVLEEFFGLEWNNMLLQRKKVVSLIAGLWPSWNAGFIFPASSHSPEIQ